MRRGKERKQHVASLHPLPSRSNQCFVNQYNLATKVDSKQFFRTFLVHHLETKAGRVKTRIWHAHPFQVHVLANEIGRQLPKTVTNG